MFITEINLIILYCFLQNTKLKSQQTLHVRDVIGQAREYENKMKMDKQIPYECVEKTLWSKRCRARDFEKTVEGILDSFLKRFTGSLKVNSIFKFRLLNTLFLLLLMSFFYGSHEKI